jgi:hypothetical protein
VEILKRRKLGARGGCLVSVTNAGGQNMNKLEKESIFSAPIKSKTVMPFFNSERPKHLIVFILYNNQGIISFFNIVVKSEEATSIPVNLK